MEKINSEDLQSILILFDRFLSHNSDQELIYQDLQQIIESTPLFYFYFIHILRSSFENPDKSRLYFILSIACLRRYIKIIDEKHMISFVDSVIPIINEIILNQSNELRSYALILLEKLVIYSGLNLIEPFDQIIEALLQNEGMAPIVLDSLRELSEDMFLIKNKHLANPNPFAEFNPFMYMIQQSHLISLASILANRPNSKEISIFLSIVLNIITSEVYPEEYLAMVYATAWHFILTFYSQFQDDALIESMSIATHLLLKTGEDNFGDFMHCCILQLGDKCAEPLNILNHGGEIPLHYNLICGLFHLLGFDDDNEETTIGEIAQEILDAMIELYQNEVEQILLSLLSNSQNPFQIFRALYLLDNVEFEHNQTQLFSQLAIEGLENQEPYRGDAALYLSQTAINNNLHLVYFEKILQYSMDHNFEVRQKIFNAILDICMDNLEFDIQPAWLDFLFTAFQFLVEMNDNQTAQLVAQIISLLFKPEVQLQNETVQNFFKFILDVYFSDEKEAFFSITIIILDVLFHHIEFPYSEFIDQMIKKIEMKFNDFDQIMHLDSYCSFLQLLSEIYPQVIPILISSLSTLTTQYENKFLTIPSSFWQLLVSYFKNNQITEENKELFIRSFQLALGQYHFNSSSTDLNLLATFFSGSLSVIDDETYNHLFTITLSILNQNLERLNEFMNVGSLFKLLIEKQETIPKDQYQFIESQLQKPT